MTTENGKKIIAIRTTSNLDGELMARLEVPATSLSEIHSQPPNKR